MKAETIFAELNSNQQAIAGLTGQLGVELVEVFRGMTGKNVGSSVVYYNPGGFVEESLAPVSLSADDIEDLTAATIAIYEKGRTYLDSFIERLREASVDARRAEQLETKAALAIAMDSI